MNRWLFLFLLCFPVLAKAEKPKDGTYTYAVAFEEWKGRSLGASCTVIIRGDSIEVQHNGSNLTGRKGDVLFRGLLLKHRTGRWIIGRSAADRNAKEIGGCTNGPLVIDLKRKRLWLC